MKRVNIHLDEELDKELTREAARVGLSKAALLREAARVFLNRRWQPSDDLWDLFTGAIRDAKTDVRHPDEIIYG